MTVSPNSTPAAGWLIDASAFGIRYILSGPKAPMMLSPWGSLVRLDQQAMDALVAEGVEVDPKDA